MTEQIPPLELTKNGKVKILLIISGLLAMWILAVYAYFTLPQEVPVHFELSGTSTTYGAKSTVFSLSALFSIVPLSFLLLTKYRFTLINKFPFLINFINLPVPLSQIPKVKRNFWINKLFEIVLLPLNVAITYSLLLIEFGIYQGMQLGKLPWWLGLILLSIPVWLILLFIFMWTKLQILQNKE